MGAMGFTPRVRDALNTAVINKFDAGVAAGSTRISGLLDVCGLKEASVENISALVLGRNFRLRRRDPNSNAIQPSQTNIYENRAKLGEYIEFLDVPRRQVLYPGGIDRAGVASSQLGLDVAEAPTLMVEALVPAALAINDHTGTPFFSAAKPIKPGSATTFPNLLALGALDFTSYDQAEKALANGIKDEDGRACGSRVRVLAVGQGYKQIGREIVENSRPKDYAGGDNLRSKDGVQLIVVPDWDDDFWCVFDTYLDDDRPFWFVRGRTLQIKPLHIDPEEAWCIENNLLRWALEGDMAVALGNPRRAVMAVDDTDPAAIAAIVAKYASKFELNDFSFDLA